MQTSASAAVVDCSLIADLLLSPSSVGSDIEAFEVWHAPVLLQYEIASVLRGHLLGGRIDGAAVGPLLQACGGLAIRWWSPDDMLTVRALELAHNMSSYGTAYVSLAEALAVPLVTRDQRFARASRGIVDVHVL